MRGLTANARRRHECRDQADQQESDGDEREGQRVERPDASETAGTSRGKLLRSTQQMRSNGLYRDGDRAGQTGRPSTDIVATHCGSSSIL
jgi:hypothetical protein